MTPNVPSPTLAGYEHWGLCGVNIFWLPELSSAFRVLSTSPESFALVFGPAGKKPLAWLLICQESNISRGLAWFQVLPDSFPPSVAELLARISWL